MAKIVPSSSRSTRKALPWGEGGTGHAGSFVGDKRKWLRTQGHQESPFQSER